MNKCKHCGRELSNKLICSSCARRIQLIRQFLEECEEFKKIINYEEILRIRAEERGDEA